MSQFFVRGCGFKAKSAVEGDGSSSSAERDSAHTKALRKAIKVMISKAHALDLCFLLDATSSMKSSMEMVKTRVAEMVGGIKAAYPECALRLSLVLYFDYNYEIGENKGCDFTTDYTGKNSTFLKALQSVQTRSISNPDNTEDVFTGLQQVATLDWKAPSRLLVHICDAPCHGRRFHDCPERGSTGVLYDHYLDGDKYGRDIADLLENLLGQCQINQYFFCHLNESTTKMIQEFKKVVGESTDWIKDVHIEDINTIPQAVVVTSRDTIGQTISTSTTGMNTSAHHGYSFIPEKVVNSRPDWVKIREVEGQLYKHRWYTSLEELLTRIRNGQQLDVEEMDPIAVKIAPHAFSADGALRWPYHALVPRQHSRFMVVKRFKMQPQATGNSPSFESKKRYMSQMEVQTVAAQMAHEFNERCAYLGHLKVKRVEFTTVFTLYANFRWYNMEHYLNGTWIRYSNNSGYVNTKDYAGTVQAFTHWTHERSGGELMVTDLQGVSQPLPGEDGSYMFLLCDPAIHSRDLTRFTNTNLGEDGFKLFFRTHKCGDLCGHLGLKPYSGSTASSKRGNSSRGTTNLASVVEE